MLQLCSNNLQNNPPQHFPISYRNTLANQDTNSTHSLTGNRCIWYTYIPELTLQQSGDSTYQQDNTCRHHQDFLLPYIAQPPHYSTHALHMLPQHTR